MVKYILNDLSVHIATQIINATQKVYTVDNNNNKLFVDKMLIRLILYCFLGLSRKK